LIVPLLIILFLLFYIQLFSYFCCKHVNKRSVQFSSVLTHSLNWQAGFPASECSHKRQ